MVEAGIAAAAAGHLVTRALASMAELRPASTPVTLLAIGKAAAPMAAAFLAHHDGPVDAALVVSTHATVPLPGVVEWHPSAHPVPSAASERAGRRALELAAAARGRVVVLLSGGASSLVAVPAEGVSLEDKRRVTTRLLDAGADIRALNTVRKHLSAIKGGGLAASARGPVLALAVSDVVGDDLSVIGSGPTVADPTTFADALDVIDRFGGRAVYPDAVVRRLVAGAAGARSETPKPGDARLASVVTRLIGSHRNVVSGAREAAERAGYRVYVIETPVVGEARLVASALVRHALELAKVDDRRDAIDRRDAGPTRACGVAVLSAGETTVKVIGHGRGGRNQELALAAAAVLAEAGHPAVFASVGTDGIDGPTDAAGGIVDTRSRDRLNAAGLTVEQVLDRNDSYTALATLGDLIKTGPTDTNVGDLQVLLVQPLQAPGPRPRG